MQLNHKFQGASFDSLMLSFVKFLTIAVGIISTMILSRHLSLESYGTYSQGLLIISLGTSFSVLGLGDAVNYYFNQSGGEKREYLNTVFAIEFAAGVLVFAAIMLFQGRLTAYFLNPLLYPLYILIAFRPLFGNLSLMLQVLHISIGNARLVAYRNVIIALLKLAAVMVTSFLTKDIATIFVVLLAVEAVQTAAFAAVFFKRGLVINPLKAKLRLVFPILRYCVPMAVYVMTNSLARDMDKLIIGRYCGTDVLAIYTNCAKVLPFDIVATAFATVMLPYITRYLSKQDYEKGRNLLANYLRIGYMSTWMLVGGAVVAAREMVCFLYGPQYLPGVRVFIIYLLVDMCRFTNLSLVLSAAGRTKQLMFYSLVSVAANYVLNIVLYQLIGVEGPAIATFIVMLGMSFALMSQSANILKGKLLGMLGLKEMLLLLVQMAIAGLAAAVVRTLLLNAGLHQYIVMFVVYLLFAGSVFVLNRKKLIGLFQKINHLKMQ